MAVVTTVALTVTMTMAVVIWGGGCDGVVAGRGGCGGGEVVARRGVWGGEGGSGQVTMVGRGPRDSGV
ncbi:unnamed protein product [Prunus armeniaca]|uniref:Glycine-rich protein n=1 Tax=Prunus armeniaca TaxID=36596 RepID=A0A6J5TH33_PRUAR|nr:unnamed protein product [Prunus armeniaca]